MIVSSKLTWGLAWTGLAVILAVPSADFVTGQLAGHGAAAVVTSTTDPVTAGPGKAPAGPAVTTTVTKTGVVITPAGGKPAGSADPVNDYLKKNKALPDYLSDGATPADAAPAQVANIAPPSAAPIPFPRPADPAPRVATTRPVAPPSAPPASAPVVIVDEPATPPQVASTKPVPPANIADDTASWRRPGLTQYLEREGLLSDSGADTTAAADDSYDPDGFYLSDGPNDSRAQRRARVLQMFGDDPNGPVPPASFDLF